MKNNFFILGAFLCTALFVTSCTDDNKDDDENEGKASIIVGINMQPQADMGYIVPIQDMKAGTMSFANAVETKITPYLMSYRDWVFYVPGTSEGTIVKYSRQDDGTLKVEGRLEVATAAPMFASIAFVSATKAYASAPNDNKIIIFNPTTMVKTGEINVARPEYGLDGSSTPNPLGLILRDGKLYVGCGEFDQMPICKSGAHVLIIDEATDTPEKIIHDTRLSAASIFDCGMFIDEKGDLYVTCWGSYGYVPDQKFGLLRIKKGATEFDPDYCFNMTDMNVEGVQGGKLQYSISNFYAGNGELYVLAYCPAFASASPDYINEKTNYCLKADLYHCTMKALNLPRTNGYSCAINKYGDDILFGLATEQNGTGIFTYNRKTDQCSSAPVVKTQGTLMDILVFE